MSQPILEHAVLEGERATLRPLRSDDAATAFPLIHRRREILDWLIWQGPETVGELEETYARWITPSDEGHNYHLAILDRETDEFAGTIGVRFADHPFVGDVGYWLAVESWGKGLGTDANFLAAHLGFRHLGATVLTAEVFVGNDASCRVLEKNGYRREKSAQMRPLADPDPRVDREQWLYSLTRQRFEELFEQRLPEEEDVRVAEPRDHARD